MPSPDQFAMEPPRPPTRTASTAAVDMVPVDGSEAAPATLVEALSRMAEAQDTLRAIGAGEIDAFVVSDGGTGRRVFTLSTADRPYRMFVENMRDGAATISSTGLILYANRRLADLLRRPRADVLGATLAEFVVDGDPSHLPRLGERDGVGATVEWELLAGDGRHVPVLVGVSRLDVDGGYLSCLTFTDLSAQKAQEREISRLGLVQAARLADLQRAQAQLTLQATHDALTGLPNRALLVDRIDQALAQAARSSRCTAVFVIDLDRFKQVNDIYGHAVGDAVLREVGQQLVHALRPMDTVARIGGNEFVALTLDVDSELHAVDIGTRLVAELGNQAHGLEDSDRVTASVGIAVSVDGRGPAEILLNEADAAMYQAKSLGGGRAEVFDARLGLQAKQRAAARRMLQSALDEHRVLAHYQPIIDVASGFVAGFEALARISGADGGMVQPSAFIPIAEETGLVVPLGAEVMAMACRAASHWQQVPAGSRPLTVAVNLSSRQFERGDLASTVRQVLETSRLDPGRLHLELTETAIIDLQPDVLAQLSRVRDLGVEIGLDDFGTGYGSLTHLRRLPLTFVKIDQSFVQGLGTELGDDRIVSAVINLAHNLGLRSIAEGVETEQQWQVLQEMACHQAQGYLLARPMPLERMFEVLGHPLR